MTYRHVLVGTDGSATAAAAVVDASRAAAGLGVPLVVVTAWQRDQPDGPARSEEARYPGGSAAAMDAQWAIEATSDAAGTARRHGVEDVRQVQAIGAPAEALLDAADTYPGSLLVVGTVGLHARSERLVGNVPHQLTHHSPVDLLLSSGVNGDAGVRTVALATDGSPTAAVAVGRGSALARALGAEATVVTVAGSRSRGERVLERATRRDRDLTGLATEIALTDDVPDGLAELATRHDLLVIGNKGMSGPGRLLGSVANRVTHHVDGDLLLVNTTRSRR